MKPRCCRQPTFTDPPRFPTRHYSFSLTRHQCGHPPTITDAYNPCHSFDHIGSESAPRYTSRPTKSRQRCSSVSYGYAPTNTHISEALTLRPSLIRVDCWMSTGTPTTVVSHDLILPSHIVMNTLLRWSNYPMPLWRDGVGMLLLHATFQGSSVALIASVGLLVLCVAVLSWIDPFFPVERSQ